MSTIRFKFAGKVQGVGLRQFVKKTATDLELVGWVKNEDDGSVQGVVHGLPESVAVFFKECKNGSLSEHIEQIQIEKDAEEIKFDNFIIKF